MSSFENKVHGASVLGLWFGGSIVLLGVVPALFCRERLSDIPEARPPEKQSIFSNLNSFFQGLVTAMQCKPFTKLCAATFLVFNGYQLGISFALYVMIYYLFDGDNKAAGQLNGQWGSLTAICTIAVIPLTAFIAGKIGKCRTFSVTISLSIVGYAMKWIGYNPEYPYWLLASCPFVAFGTGSLFTLMGSMISDVCDYDELESNKRREGVFGAIYWWMVKVGMALALLLSGYFLVAPGFITPQPGSTVIVVQSDQTMLCLRVFDVVIPIVTSTIALIIMSTYEITEDKARKTRQLLEQRRGRFL